MDKLCLCWDFGCQTHWWMYSIIDTEADTEADEKKLRKVFAKWDNLTSVICLLI